MSKLQGKIRTGLIAYSRELQCNYISYLGRRGSSRRFSRNSSIDRSCYGSRVQHLQPTSAGKLLINKQENATVSGSGTDGIFAS